MWIFVNFATCYTNNTFPELQFSTSFRRAVTHADGRVSYYFSHVARASTDTAVIHRIANFFYSVPGSNETGALELWLGSIGPLKVEVISRGDVEIVIEGSVS